MKPISKLYRILKVETLMFLTYYFKVVRFSFYLCKIFLNIARAIILNIMGKLGLTEILVIVAIILLLFGGKKIPELMKGLGSGIKEFKNAAKDENQPAATKKEEEKI